MRVHATQLELIEPGTSANKYYRGYILETPDRFGVMFQWARRGAQGQISPVVYASSAHDARWRCQEQLEEKEYKKGYEEVGRVSFEIATPIDADKKTLHATLDEAFLAAWSQSYEESADVLLGSRGALGSAGTSEGTGIIVALRQMAEAGRSQPWAGAARRVIADLIHADTPASREVVGLARASAGLDGHGRYAPIAPDEDIALAVVDEATRNWLRRYVPTEALWELDRAEGDTPETLGIALGLAGAGARPGELVNAIRDARLCLA